MKVPPINGNAAQAAATSPVRTATLSLKCAPTPCTAEFCQDFNRTSHPASGLTSCCLRKSAHSAGVAVIATTNEAITAKMNASASGPTKCPCTLEVNSSGRNTAITTAVA